MSTRRKEFVQRPVDADCLEHLADIHPVLRKLYAARGVKSTSELELSLSKIHSFRLLKGIEIAAAILRKAIFDNQRILVVGDFDADGATSCAVAVRALRAMDAQQVSYLVPNRFEFGYGLTPEIVDLATGIDPDVIVTVDNGISSIAGVERAREKGIKVIITDHHLAGSTLPNADAIVNPNQEGCSFPSKNLAGVGVIFYLLSALRAVLREAGWFDQCQRQEPNLASLLDLVALGTVADVVALDTNNRILVQQGLARIRAGRACPGINALIQVSGREQGCLTSADLGFALGPRLNAAGRLEDMSLGIECLIEEDCENAYEIAVQLDALNRERRTIEEEMKKQALAELENLPLNADRVGICLYRAEWHQGVVGILAARIKERFNRPVIAFADSDADEIKGSARSIPGFHIRDALDSIASSHPGLLEKFGGHSMAAGLTLKREDFTRFAEAFNQQVCRSLSKDDLQAKVVNDGPLTGEDFNLELAERIRLAGPWGQAFPEPLFTGQFRILEQRLVGEKHIKLQLAAEDSGEAIEAIAFFVDLEEWPNEARSVRLAYRLEVNEFRGQRSVQLVADYLEPQFGV